MDEATEAVLGSVQCFWELKTVDDPVGLMEAAQPAGSGKNWSHSFTV